MGKTSKPLRIRVDSTLFGAPWVIALQQQGHLVSPILLTDCDLLLGPSCARFLPGMERFLDSFIKGARAVKRPKEKPDGDTTP